MRLCNLKHIIFTQCIFVLCLLLVTVCSDASNKKELWDYWAKSDEYNIQTINHSVWDYLLTTYVVKYDSGINLVAYEKINKKDTGGLSQYIEYLSTLQITLYSRDEQLVYWINLYNAITWSIILDYYPVKSIRKINISPGIFSTGPWDKKTLLIENRAVSLNDIEHKILRPIWADDRIHYALNCASIGCPNISTVAYTVNNVEYLLNQSSRAYINHPRGVYIKSNGDLQVSSIFNWYVEDFAYDDVALVEYFKKYADIELSKHLDKWDSVDNAITYKYDWALNEAQ